MGSGVENILFIRSLREFAVNRFCNSNYNGPEAAGINRLKSTSIAIQSAM
jgi:hypothetical protein